MDIVKNSIDCVINNSTEYDIVPADRQEFNQDISHRDEVDQNTGQESELQKAHRELGIIRESMIYETKIIAFVDILGWKDSILKSVTDIDFTKDLGLALNTVQWYDKFIKGANEMKERSGIKADLRWTHFSDCFVLSTSNTFNGWHEMMWYLDQIVRQMLTYGHFLRGGISVGEIIHRDNLIFGPGLIRAYELESKKAIYPRIIVDSTISDSFVQRSRWQWRLDKDGEWFFHYIKPFIDLPPVDSDDKRRILEQIRGLVIVSLERYKENYHIYQKYEWLANYYNSVLVEVPLVDLPPITIGVSPVKKSVCLAKVILSKFKKHVSIC